MARHKVTVRRGRTALLLSFAATFTVVAAPPAFAVNPGSVSPYINNTAGSSSFFFGAVAAGWPRGTITVSYNMYWGPSSTGPWTPYFSDSRQCYSSTSCSTPSSGGVCTDGWYKNVGHASGPGGRAENDGRYVVKYIYGITSTVPPATAGTSSVSSECKIHYTPI